MCIGALAGASPKRATRGEESTFVRIGDGRSPFPVSAFPYRRAMDRSRLRRDDIIWDDTRVSSGHRGNVESRNKISIIIVHLRP